MIYDAIIIGGGAAGMMAAIEAGKRGQKVILLEKNKLIGAKILISGGGRCNFTNINANHSHFISSNKNFCRSALSRYSPQDFVSLVEEYEMPYYEKKLGQLFCEKSSREINKILLSEAEKYKVEIRTNSNTQSINYEDELFEVIGDNFHFKSLKLLLACGGLSFPSKGATDFGYRIAKQFGHSLIQTKPGLVPFTLHQTKNLNFTNLSGISLDTIVKVNKREFRENILFTHKGMSGPAILQISNYIQDSKTFYIDIDPENKLADKIDISLNKLPSQVLSEIFPKRFVEEFIAFYKFDKPMNQMGRKAFNKFSEMINNWEITISGTEGYKKAEVTLGGIDTREVSSKTMESKLQENLYFAGELLDVTGWLGGYNLTWAWASGFVAGQSL